MFRLFLGVVLTLLTYEVQLGNGSIGIIPHFIGFFLIIMACRDLEKEDETFSRPMIPSYIMLVYTLAFYIAKSFGVGIYLESAHPVLLYVLNILESIGTLITLYQVIFGITHFAHKNKYEINIKRPQLFYKIMAGGYILYYISYLTLVLTSSTTSDHISPYLFAYVMRIIMTVATLIFIFMYYLSWAKYMEQVEK